MITLELIKDLVEGHFDLSLEDRYRGGMNPTAKYCYYNLAFRFCKNKSTNKIAGLIGQDHATALHYRDRKKPNNDNGDTKHLFELTQQLDSYLRGQISKADLRKVGKKELQMSLNHQIEENRKLLVEIKHLKASHEKRVIDLKTGGTSGLQKKLNRIFVQLPERIQKDLLFKARVALKMNKVSA